MFRRSSTASVLLFVPSPLYHCYRTVTIFGPPFQTVHSVTRRFRHWAGPLSLATTYGIAVAFFSSGYLDVSVHQVRFDTLYIQVPMPDKSGGFPHSEIPGSQLGYQLPWAYRRFQRPSSPLDAKTSTVRPSSLHHTDLTSTDVETEPMHVAIHPVHGPTCGRMGGDEHSRFGFNEPWSAELTLRHDLPIRSKMFSVCVTRGRATQTSRPLTSDIRLSKSLSRRAIPSATRSHSITFRSTDRKRPPLGANR